MNDEILFTGNIRADEWLCFGVLCESAKTADSALFFQTVNNISRTLRKYHNQRTSSQIISSAYSFIDKQGNSVLSTAYEAKNVDIIGVASAYVLAHGIENDALYNVLVSPKVLMLHRQIGKLGAFNKNVKSIFSQMKNTGNQLWLQNLANAYAFVLPAKKQTEIRIEQSKITAQKTYNNGDIAARVMVKIASLKSALALSINRKVNVRG